MFNKKSFIILCLTLHLTIGLKSSDFCSLKQQECKGFYDKQQNYEIKCNPIKCHGKFNYDCESNTCSNNLVNYFIMMKNNKNTVKEFFDSELADEIKKNTLINNLDSNIKLILFDNLNEKSI